jgi:exosome complex exonuclease DIS3/RRP44
VTHFVKSDTAIDEEAASRGTTVYLCDRRIDMLPKLLGENLCSLRSNVERLAFSVIWELTPEAEIVDTLFTKSVILSKASLTYGEAQLRIDDESMQDPISVGVRQLNILAKKLKQKRMDAGALTLASSEVRFVKSEETQDPIDMELYQTKESNSLVEEFMLLANISVAKKIYSAFPNFACLRRHPTPPAKNFTQLIKAVALLGVELVVDSSKTLSESLEKAKLWEKDTYLDKLMRIMTTRSMTQAVYFSSGTLPYSDFHHYGLAAPIYTHFTSPIRRYADVIVHRELAAALGIEPLPASLNKENIRRLCNGMNHRHRMAQQASRASVELHTLIFFKGKKVREAAYITKVKANAFMVIVPRYGLEGIIYVDDRKGNTPFVFDEDNQKLTFENIKLQIFDKVEVQISVDMSNPHRPFVRIDCVSPPVLDLLGSVGIAQQSGAENDTYQELADVEENEEADEEEEAEAKGKGKGKEKEKETEIEKEKEKEEKDEGAEVVEMEAVAAPVTGAKRKKSTARKRTKKKKAPQPGPQEGAENRKKGQSASASSSTSSKEGGQPPSKKARPEPSDTMTSTSASTPGGPSSSS